MTPSSMKPLNRPPCRMFVAGKLLYFWLTYSAFIMTAGVMNQPPPTSHRSMLTSPVVMPRGEQTAYALVWA